MNEHPFKEYLKKVVKTIAEYGDNITEDDEFRIERYGDYHYLIIKNPDFQEDGWSMPNLVLEIKTPERII